MLEASPLSAASSASSCACTLVKLPCAKVVNLRAGGDQDAFERRQAHRQHGLIRRQPLHQLLEGGVDHEEEGREEDEQPGEHDDDRESAGHPLAFQPAQERGEEDRERDDQEEGRDERRGVAQPDNDDDQARGEDDGTHDRRAQRRLDEVAWRRSSLGPAGAWCR